MAVVLMMEWDNPKEATRLKEYREATRDVSSWDQRVKNGIVKSFASWTDGSGHIIFWVELENVEDFAKLWGDKEYQMFTTRFHPLVDNLHIRLLRPAIVV